jgi:hypothetical protein
MFAHPAWVAKMDASHGDGFDAGNESVFVRLFPSSLMER